MKMEIKRAPITKEESKHLDHLFKSFKNGMHSAKSEKPRMFLKRLGLDHNFLNVGFNSGQFHHRKSEEFRKPYIELGILTKSDVPVNHPNRVAYTTFGTYSIVFPLHNSENRIVNFYAYRFNLSQPVGVYLNNQGIYPNYPKPLTTRLYVVNTPIEAASLLQSGVLENRESVVSLYDGKWTEELSELFSNLDNLQEVIFLNSKTNKKAIAPLLNQVNVLHIELEQSINESWLAYGTKGFWSLLQDELTDKRTSPLEPTKQKKEFKPLSAITDTEFCFSGTEIHYTLYGNLPANPTLLEMQFELRTPFDEVLRTKLDLFDTPKIQKELFEWTQTNEINFGQCMLEINHITEELQRIRKTKSQRGAHSLRGFSSQKQQRAKELLNDKSLIKQLDELLEESGIIGEKQNRLLLFIIASSYKFSYNLHAVIQAEQLETASEFVLKITDCIPQEDRYDIDLTTSRSFRYYGNSVINGKLLVIPDYSGVTSNKGINDLKRLQSKGVIINDAPKKTSNGLLHTVKQQVKGHCSSIGACMNTKRYFENEPKTVVVSMDTGKEKLQKLMEYDCRKMAGLIDETKEENAKEQLRYILKNIHAMQVVNPFSEKLMLPAELPYARTLTVQLLQFVSLITLFFQHQREKDEKGRLITTKEDVSIAIRLFLKAIIVYVDELDATTRHFFERLKQFVKQGKRGEKGVYSSLEIRASLNLSKTTANRYLKTLVEFEYIKKMGYKNTGYQYKIINWNNLQHLQNLLEERFANHSEPSKLVHQTT